MRRLDRGVNVETGDAGNAEIQDFGLTILRDEDVRGFQITMNDAAIVRMLYGIADRDQQLEATGNVKRVRLNVLGDRWSADELHYEMRGRHAIAEMERQDLGDSWVLEPAQHISLTCETFQQLRVPKTAT
jgi:hypothetical protein